MIRGLAKFHHLGRVLITICVCILVWICVGLLSPNHHRSATEMGNGLQEHSQVMNSADLIQRQVEPIEDGFVPNDNTGDADLDIEDELTEAEVEDGPTTESPESKEMSRKLFANPDREALEKEILKEEQQFENHGKIYGNKTEQIIKQSDHLEQIKEQENIEATTAEPEDSTQEGDLDMSRSIQFRYVPPDTAGAEGPGKRLNVGKSLLRKIGMPLKSFSTLTSRSVLDFVFATASHDRFFIESKDAVAGIQKFFPGYKIFYYDLGLLEHQRNQVKSWCNVELRTLDYGIYPEHVTEYRTMAYKPIIIHELFHENKAVVWMDPQFRAFRGNWTHIFETILSNGGMYLMKCTGIPGYVSTHPKLYRYFPANEERYKVIGDYWSGGLYLFNTEKIYWNIVYWWTLCALDVNCIAPTNDYFCKSWAHWQKYVDRNEPEKTKWGKCHRFGQSVISLLTNNLYGYRSSRFTHFDPDPVASVIRNATWLHDLKYCKT